MMTVLYGIGMILRFILKIALLPVQAALTLLMLAIGFIGGFANIACGLIGSFFVIGGNFTKFCFIIGLHVSFMIKDVPKYLNVLLKIYQK